MNATSEERNARIAEFWAWSLERYEAEGVAGTLVRLQDDCELDVNILLWCGWCAVNFREIPELVLKKAVDLTARWTRDVTNNLRVARRALKTPPAQAKADDASALRETVKNAELAAEKMEQQMLARLAADALEPMMESLNSLTRFRRNLVNYAAIAGAQRRAGFSVALLDDLSRALLSDAAARDHERD